MEDHRVAVIGAGNGGKALAGHIASKGHEVAIYEGLEPGQDFLRLKEARRISLQGDIACSGELICATTNIEEAIDGAQVIIVVVPAFAHEPIFNQLMPSVKDGDRIILVPGNFGTLLFKKMMREKGVSKKVSISETASLPYACRATSHNTVMIHKAKRILKIATHPADANAGIVQMMNTIMDIFVPARNVLEVSLDNINSVLHPLPVLLNVGAIERNPETFRHYMDGVTPLISDKIDRMDKERLAVGKAYSLNLLPTLDQLKMYYGENDSTSIFDYVNSNDSPYKDIVGHSLYSRYITEDIPYVVLPTMLLGEKAGIDMPLFRLCVDLACQLHDRDYVESGHSLRNLGISDMDRQGLLDYLSR
jgi:opine dehydrogenase